MNKSNLSRNEIASVEKALGHADGKSRGYVPDQMADAIAWQIVKDNAEALLLGGDLPVAIVDRLIEMGNHL